MSVKCYGHTIRELDIKALARDDSNISSVVSQNDRMEINDTRYLVWNHISDIDDQEWSGLPLPLTSLTGSQEN